MLRYKPNIYSSSRDLTVQDVADYTYREFLAISAAINEAAEGRFDVNYREPTKYREGHLLYADGSTWDPGSGEGYYFRDGSAWNKLYSAPSDIPWETPGTIGSTTPNTGKFTTLTVTGQALLANGTASAPALAFTGETNTGLLLGSSGNLDVTLLSSIKARFAADFLNFTSSIGLRFWSGSGAFSGLLTTLMPEATGVVAQRDGTNAQSFRVYNTYTSSTSYERGIAAWASNVFQVGTEKGSGGGTARALAFITDGTERARVTDTGLLNVLGSVLIGASGTTADQVLHLSTGSSSAQLVLERTGGSAGKWAIGADNVGFSVFLPPGYSRLLVLTSGGHLGVGGTPTNFPGYGVTDTFGSSGGYVLARDTNSTVIGQLLGDPGTSFVYVGSRTNNGLIFTTNNTERARLTAVGHFQSIVSIGYGSTAGGAVTQATNKSTGVTLNKICGQITTHNAALAAAAEVAFVVTNSTVAATDTVIVSIASGGTAGSYFIGVAAVAAGSFTIVLGNCSGGSLSQAVVINFAVIKAVNA